MHPQRPGSALHEHSRCTTRAQQTHPPSTGVRFSCAALAMSAHTSTNCTVSTTSAAPACARVYVLTAAAMTACLVPCGEVLGVEVLQLPEETDARVAKGEGDEDHTEEQHAHPPGICGEFLHRVGWGDGGRRVEGLVWGSYPAYDVLVTGWEVCTAWCD